MLLLPPLNKQKLNHPWFAWHTLCSGRLQVGCFFFVFFWRVERFLKIQVTSQQRASEIDDHTMLSALINCTAIRWLVWLRSCRERKMSYLLLGSFNLAVISSSAGNNPVLLLFSWQPNIVQSLYFQINSSERLEIFFLQRVGGTISMLYWSELTSLSNTTNKYWTYYCFPMRRKPWLHEMVSPLQRGYPQERK